MKKAAALLLSAMMLLCSLTTAMAGSSSVSVIGGILASVEAVGNSDGALAVDEDNYTFPDGPLLYLNLAAAEQDCSMIFYARTADGTLYGFYWNELEDSVLIYLLYLMTANYDLITGYLPEAERPFIISLNMGTDTNSQLLVSDSDTAAEVYEKITTMMDSLEK